MAGEKLALTLWSAFIVRLQLPVPLHAPPQPWKTEPLAGVAVSLTGVHHQAAAPGAAARTAPALEPPAIHRRGGQGDRGPRIEAGAAHRTAINPGRRAGHLAALAARDGHRERVGDLGKGRGHALT